MNCPESRAIATKLTHSATARREVEVLQKTWELLDYLPRPRASEDLTTRTLTEVQQLASRGGRFESAAKQAAGRAMRVGLWVLGSCLACLLGFAIMHWIWPNPTAKLARDLPIAEHLDEYRDVQTFDFLDQLANSPEFSSDPE